MEIDTLFILTIVVGSHIDVSAVDSIDGKLLADELRIIKREIGVNVLQEQFDKFPYVRISDTGHEILKRIQTNLDTALESLDTVLKNVKDKLVSVNQDFDLMDLPNCCDLLDNTLTFALKFQTKVDFNQACVTSSPIKTDNIKYPTKDIGAIMKKDYEDNKNVLWQHYSTREGVFILYPATKLTNCNNFDPRFTTPYASTAFPTDKDVVVVIDTSESMKQSSGVPLKTKIVIAKEAANNVIQTLKPNDRVGVVTFNEDASSPSGNSYHPCYQGELSFATKENTDKLKNYIFSVDTGSQHSNFEKALDAAFEFYNSSADTLKVQNRDQVILFISDGKSTSVSDPVQVISTENSKLQNRISIFTYLIGEDKQAKIQLQNMASQTLHDPSYGPKQIEHFEHFPLSTQKLLSVKLATFYEHLSTDGQSDQSTFTSPYVDPFSGIGLITSLCRTVKVATGFHGVVCTDVKISELLSEIEYFSEEEYSYGFMIDGTGRVLMHPLLPNAAFVKSNEDPVLVDISVLERVQAAQTVIESMKRGGSGFKNFTKVFTKPRGKLINDGSKDVILNANFFWGPSTVRSSVWATYKAEQFWKQNPVSYVSWRYIGTKSGIMRTYPGILMHKNFDHEKRPWWRQALGHPNTMYLTTPYVDGWGSGIVLTFIHTLHKANSSAVTATVAADFPLQYFNWFISKIYPACEDGNKCIILDNSGFIVMHPRLKDTTDESDFHEPKHITVEEPGFAEILKNKLVLNFKECQDFSENTNLRSFRVTMPSGFSNGLDFKDTDDKFEIRPIAESNLLIIRFKAKPSSTCSCDGSKSPDVVKCQGPCQCLCHIPIIYDVCANRYNTESASSPCSARIPDTSGKNEPDDTDGLKACYVPTCYKKTTKQDCYSEAECTWCEYTDLGQQIATPCCRLKEDCYFGKTKPDKRDTCAPLLTANEPKGNDSYTIIWIVSGSVVGGIILTIIVFGGVKYFKICDRTDNTDPYIDAIDDLELPQYTEKQESIGSEFKGKTNQNFYDG